MRLCLYATRSLFLLFTTLFSWNAQATVRYVKMVAMGMGNGASWVNASSDLQAVINASAPGDEVWVAAGTYLPTQDPLGNPNPIDPRDVTFRIKEGISVYGGFAGTETNRQARNWTLNRTILSGDIGVPNTVSDNCYHVVTIIYQASSAQYAILDGFTITRGVADNNSVFIMNGTWGGTYPDISRSSGGGVYVAGGDTTTLRNLKVVANFSTSSGGGINAYNGKVMLYSDSISANTSSSGGGCYLSSSFAIDSCWVYSNSATTGGGAAIVGGGTLANSIIHSNTATTNVGGGLYLSSSQLTTVKNNFIYNNAANNYWGGGIFLDGGNYTSYNLLSNVLLNNSAEKGGGIYFSTGTGTFINNTFVGNTATLGSGGIHLLTSNPHVIQNNIFWKNYSNNTAQWDIYTWRSNYTGYTFKNNLLQFPANNYTVSPGTNNLFALDPSFINDIQPLGADNILGTPDDGLALTACSPAINAGITPTAALPTDIIHQPRVGSYDIGAYEFQGTAANPVRVGAITGDSLICLGNMATLGNAVPGGVWSSSNPALVSINSSGIITGVGTGAAVISYIHGTSGCSVSIARKTVVVTGANALLPLIGPDSICSRASLQLSSSLPLGTWTSSNPAVATVNATGRVSGWASGTATIRYRVGRSGCADSVSKTITVLPAPPQPSAIGSYKICIDPPVQFTITSNTPGGIWTTVSGGTIASVDTSGLVKGVTPGQDTVEYTLTNSLGCIATVRRDVIVQVPPAVPARFICCDTLCIGDTVKAYSPSGGASLNKLLSSDSAVVIPVYTATGEPAFHALANGTATLTLAYANSMTGCITTKTMTVTVLPPRPVVAPITGSSSVCVNGTLQLSNATPGGFWVSNSGGTVASVSNTGLVTGVRIGTDTISYIVPASAGCPGIFRKIITVNRAAVAGVIIGPDSVCANQTALYTGTAVGGVWSVPNAVRATINPNGQLTTLSQGATTIEYTVVNSVGCSATASKPIYIKSNVPVAPISGPAVLCQNSTAQYTNAVAGGIWSTSSNGNKVSISSTGMAAIQSLGTDTILYTRTDVSGCSSFATFPVSANAPVIDSFMLSFDSMCVGEGMYIGVSGHHPTITFSNANPAVASLTSHNRYTGIGPGIDTIYASYLSNGCPVTIQKPFTIISTDTSVLIGQTVMCKGDTQQLIAVRQGGYWVPSQGPAIYADSFGRVIPMTTGSFRLQYIINPSPMCYIMSRFEMTVVAADTRIQQSGARLAAVGNQAGATYQWINCDSNNRPINGATNSVYTATHNGRYAVIVSYMGCQDTSACVSVTGLGLTENSQEEPFVVVSLHNRLVQVNTGQDVAVSLRLYDLQGKLVKEAFPAATVTEWDASTLASGLYIVHIHFKNSVAVRRINIP